MYQFVFLFLTKIVPLQTSLPNFGPYREQREKVAASVRRKCGPPKPEELERRREALQVRRGEGRRGGGEEEDEGGAAGEEGLQTNDETNLILSDNQPQCTPD